MDVHLARRALDHFAGAGVVVQRTAVLLQRRMHGRHLFDGTGEAADRGLQRGRVHLHRAGGQHRAFAVAGAGALAQAQRGAVGLVGIQADLAELGGRTKTQRQQAGGQRVERAGVAGFLGAQQPFGLLQGVVAGPAQRLVEQQHTVQRAARRFHPGRRPLQRRPGRTAGIAGLGTRQRSRFGGIILSRGCCWLHGSARSIQRRAPWCGRTGNAGSARCGSAGA